MVAHTAFDLSWPSARRVGPNAVVTTMEESRLYTRPQSAQRPDTSFLASLPRRSADTSQPRYALPCTARHEWWALAIHKNKPSTPRRLVHSIVPSHSVTLPVSPPVASSAAKATDSSTAPRGVTGEEHSQDHRWPGSAAGR